MLSWVGLVKGLKHPFLMGRNIYLLFTQHYAVIRIFANGTTQVRISGYRVIGIIVRLGSTTDQLQRYLTWEKEAEILDMIHVVAFSFLIWD